MGSHAEKRRAVLTGALHPERPMRICDVGASPLSVPPYQGLLDDGVAHVYGFEPNPAQYQKLVAEERPNATYFCKAVGLPGQRTLYVHPAAGFTSLYPMDGAALRAMAAPLVKAFNVKYASIDAPIATLSGGNVQRAALARELSGDVRLLICANPCFGLDFGAAGEIRARLMAARDAGAAVLLISEDLDEIMDLSDRVLVMSEGRIAYRAAALEADRAEIGRCMAGRH